MMMMFTKKISIALIAMGAFTISSFGYVVGFDVPANDARVTDQADIFSEQEEAYLEAQLQALEEVHKAEIAVLTVSSLQGEDINEVGYQVASTRGIGKDEADNGLLILVAPNERERRIEVGYGLEGDVPDITAFQLGRKDLVPAFRQGQYFQGVTNLVESLSGVVAGTYTPEMYANQKSAREELLDNFFVGLLMLSFMGFFFGIFARSHVDMLKQEKRPMDEGTKKDMFQLASVFNMLPGLFFVGPWALLYLIPLYYIWKWMITSKHIHIGTSSGSSGWHSGGGSSFGGGFSGFGGGSFGGGGASGGW